MKEHLNDGGKLSEQDFLHALESAIFFVSMSVYGFSINTLWIIYESEGHIARRLSFKENSKDFSTRGNVRLLQVLISKKTLLYDSSQKGNNSYLRCRRGRLRPQDPHVLDLVPHLNMLDRTRR